MASVVGGDACRTIGCTKGKVCTARAYLGSPAYFTSKYAVCRVQYVLYAQMTRCGCRRWCCGFRNTHLPRTLWISHDGSGASATSVCHRVRTLSCRSLRA
eukprot:294794-Chlamydomonas_euryale.AAC.1